MKFYTVDGKIAKVVGPCVDELYKLTGVEELLKDKRTRSKGREFIFQLVLNVFHLSSLNADAIIFSRDRNYWVIGNTYNPCGFTFKMVSVIDLFEQQNLVQICRGDKFWTPDGVEKISSFVVPRIELVSVVKKHLHGKISTSDLRPHLSPIYVNEKPEDGGRKKALKYPEFDDEIVFSDLNGLTIPFSSKQQEEFIIKYNNFLHAFTFSMGNLTPEQQIAYEKFQLSHSESCRFPWLRRIFNYDKATDNYFH